MNEYFSEVRLRRNYSDEELEQTAFSWGIENVAARDALISLLEQSATTMTWILLCDTQPACGLNINPMVINSVGSDGKLSIKVLNHDRKKWID